MAPIDAALAPKIPPPTQPIEYYKRHSLAAQNWGAPRAFWRAAAAGELRRSAGDRAARPSRYATGAEPPESCQVAGGYHVFTLPSWQRW